MTVLHLEGAECRSSCLTQVINGNNVLSMARNLRHVSARMKGLEQACRSSGLPLTIQRRLILEALLHRSDHPTADQVYSDVLPRVPGLSRATVYRVLETLVRIGVARKVCHPGASSRYDPKTKRHHHLICLECGRMVDLDEPSLDRIPLPSPGRLGFDISDYSIQFRGVCRDCRGASAEARPVQVKHSR